MQLETKIKFDKELSKWKGIVTTVVKPMMIW